MNAYNVIDTVHNSTTGDIKTLTLTNNYTRGEIRVGTTNRAGLAAAGLGFRLEKIVSAYSPDLANFSSQNANDGKGQLSVSFVPRPKNFILGADLSCQIGKLEAIVASSYIHTVSGFKLSPVLAAP